MMKPPGRLRRVVSHQWVVATVMFAASVLFTLVARGDAPVRIGDAFVMDDFQYTVTATRCGAPTRRVPVDDQTWFAEFIVANVSDYEGHPEGMFVWLVSIDGRHFRPSPRTLAQVGVDVQPGEAKAVTLKFTPPEGLSFAALEFVAEAASERVSVELPIGETGPASRDSTGACA